MRRVIPRSLIGLVLVALSAQLVLIWATGIGSPLFAVRDDAMEPMFHRGDLLVVTSVIPSQIAAGNVVVVEVSEAEQQALDLPSAIARRVAAIDVVDGKFAFQTDADQVATTIAPSGSGSLRGRVLANLGQVGWAMILMTNRLFLLTASIPAVVLLFVAFASRRSAASEDTIPSPSPTEEQRGVDDPLDIVDHQSIGDRGQQDRYDWLQRWCDAQLGAEQETMTPGAYSKVAGWAE